MQSIEEMNAELRGAVEARLAVSEARSEDNTALNAALGHAGDRSTARQWIHPHTKPSGSGFYWVMIPESDEPQLAYYHTVWTSAHTPPVFFQPYCWMPLTAPQPPEAQSCP